MDHSTYLKKKQWMQWHVTQSALLDERNMSMLEKFYNSGPSSIKLCTSRGPGGVQTSQGAIDCIEPDIFYPKICNRFGRPVRLGSAIQGQFNDDTIRSVALPKLKDSRPPYRNRTRDGVYVGRQYSHPLMPATHTSLWNNDTAVPRQCSFRHCTLPRLRKILQEK